MWQETHWFIELVQSCYMQNWKAIISGALVVQGVLLDKVALKAWILLLTSPSPCWKLTSAFLLHIEIQNQCLLQHHVAYCVESWN
jgi:hypothetical protein